MDFEPNRGRSRTGRPHAHHPVRDDAHGMSHGPRPDLTISIERPGSRRMRGLDGPGDRRGHGRHRERGDHPRPGPGRLQSRRGAIRDATLALLAEQPMHGYQVMQELAERSGGRWHPSAGSVYPTLQQLEDEGLVTVEDRDGRRTFALTDAGRTAATAIPAERPWSRSRRRGRPPRARPRSSASLRSRFPGRLADGPKRGSHGPHRGSTRPLSAARRRRRGVDRGLTASAGGTGRAHTGGSAVTTRVSGCSVVAVLVAVVARSAGTPGTGRRS